MDEPGDMGLPPTAPPTGLDWRHLASFASANDLSAVTRLLAAGIEVDPEEGAGVTALHWACFHGNQQMAAQLLDAGAKVNAALQSGRTPLHLAVLGQHSSIVDVLVERGATISLSSSSDGTPLELAVSSGQSDLVSRLLAAGANPSGTSSRTTTTSLLLTAMSLGHMHIAEQLLQAGAVASGYNSAGRAALHLAAECGDTRLFELWVAGGADINAKDGSGATPLHVATQKGHSQAATQLIGLGADCNVPALGRKCALHLAAGSGDTHLVAVLLAAGANPRKVDGSDDTPLHLAADAGHTAVVQQLLDAPGMGPDVAGPGSQYTALHAAAWAGQAAVIQQLVAAGANIDLYDSSSNMTPLTWAVGEEDLSTVRVLLAAGANPNVIMRDTTLLCMAVCQGAPDELIQQLVEGGADINATTEDGYTALHMAVRRRQYAAVQLLLRLGASVSIATDDSGTPLLAAVEQGAHFSVQQLVAAGANLDTLSSSDSFTAPRTPLYVAVVRGDEDMVGLLLEAGANASQGTSEGHTPLHAAAQHGHAELAVKLLAAGADVNAVSDEYGTPLAVALGRGEEAMVALLLAAGADPTLDSGEVEAPLMAAVQDSRMELVRSFLAAPAILAVKPLAPTALPGLTQPSSATGGASASAAAVSGAATTTADGAAAAVAPQGSVHRGATPAGEALEALNRAQGLQPDQLGAVYTVPAQAGAQHNSDSGNGKHNSSSARRERITAALMVAMAAEDMCMVGLLVEAGGCANTMHDSIGAPLHLAVSESDTALVAQLLEGGADVNLVSSNGTPLGMAVAAQDTELVRLLLRAGARPNQHCTAHNTPLNVAAGLQKVAIAKQLLDAGANVNRVAKGGLLPLHSAIAFGSKQMVELLLARGAFMYSSSKQYGTPIQAAVYVALQPGASKEATEVVQVLLAAGAHPNAAHHGSTTGFSLLHAAVAGRSVQLVQLLVSAGAALEAGSSEGTPLRVAVVSNAEGVLRLLLEAGANPNTTFLPDGSTPLLVAIRKNRADMAELLLAAGAQPNVACRSFGRTPLQEAVQRQQVSLALKLLAAGADPNLRPMIMHQAIGQGHELVEALLAKGVLPDVPASSSLMPCSSPLQLAVGKQCCEEVASLLAGGADASVVHRGSGDTLLHIAVRAGSSQLVGLLVASSADVNASNSAGELPLLMEARRMTSCNWGIIQRLLQHPALDCNAKDASGCTALHYAIRSSSDTGMRLLLSRGADPSVRDNKGRTLLHLAAISGDSGVVQALVEAAADVSATAGSMGWTPLLLAAAAAHQCVVTCLLAGGAAPSVSATLTDGTTALHMACSKRGTEQMVADLLSAGADPAAANSHGNTPLHLAAAAGEGGTIRPALFCNNNRELPLHMAIVGHHTAVAVQLIAAAAKSEDVCVRAVTNDGSTPIHLAAVRDSSIFKGLLGCQGVMLDQVDGAGQTALHKAAAGGHTSHLRLLVHRGARLLDADLAGATPLHLAAAGGFMDAARCLVSLGAGRDAVDAAGATPLHRLPLAADPQLVGLLATPGNIDRVVDGTTLLHTAAGSGSEEWVAAVLAAGAATGILNSQGECALVTAVRKGSSAEVRLLLLRHMLLQHKLQRPKGAPLHGAVVTAVQAALADRSNEFCKSMVALVMEVLGEDAASTLWQQLLEQHRARLPPQQGAPQQPQQQQQQQGQEREEQRRQLKGGVQIALVQGFFEACADLAQQQAHTTKPLDQAVSSLDRATPQVSNLPGGRQQAAGGAAGAAATSTEAVAQHRFVTLEHITTAAGAGKLQEVQRLSQQLPADAYTAALGAAAHAAAGAGHYQVCVQMLHQLAAVSEQEARKSVTQLGLKTEGGGKQPAKVLGPRSLALCGALLAGWQAVRRQQQQELVESVVTAAVAWKEVQQHVVGSVAGRKRLCQSTWGRLAT